jgi:hypothetical protein
MLRRGAVLSSHLQQRALARLRVASKPFSSSSSTASSSSSPASSATSRLPDDKKSLRDFIRVPSAAQSSADGTVSQCAASFPEAARIGSEESEEEPPLPSSIDQLLAPETGPAHANAAASGAGTVSGSGAGKSFFIESYGCQMNAADSEIVASLMHAGTCGSGG